MTSKIEPSGSFPAKRFKIWMLTFGWLTIVAVVVVLVTIARSCEEKRRELLFAELDAPVINTDSLSLADSVYTCIFLLRMEHPDIVMAQCIEESGGFTSLLFKEGNNCTGMRVPAQRPTLATGVLYGHACFTSWRECLADYAIWQSTYARGLTREAYLAYLDRVYAEKKGYSERLKKIINDKNL